MKWRLLIVLQVVLVVAVLNPWSRSVRIAAAIMIGVEVFLLVFVLVPVFLYQMFIKKKKFSESLAISINTVLSSLWLGV